MIKPWIKSILSIGVLWALIPLTTYAQQDDFNTQDYDWLELIIDSIESSDLCLRCDIQPSINVYYTRGYYSPPRTLRFRLYYACDNQSSVTKYFEKDGKVAGVCIVDSMSRNCEDDITALTYTFGLDIKTIWACDYGYNCSAAPKSILFPTHEVEIANDLCDKDIRTLSTTTNFVTNLWMGPDGYQSQEDKVSVNKSGEYLSVVQNELGCYDTLRVQVDTKSNMLTAIEGPDIICDASSICLAMSGFESFLWSTGETAESICVDQPGVYSVEVTNKAGCTDIIETTIRDGREHYIDLYTTTDVIYTGQLVDFHYDLSGVQPDDIVAVDWIYDEQILSHSESLSLKINEKSQVNIEIETKSGCFYSDHIEIDPLPVNKDVYFANVFNPYSNQGNNIFYPQMVPGTVEAKDFTIFDRWGNQVYYASTVDDQNVQIGWDGYLSGELLPTGTYLFMTNLIYSDGTTEMKTGTVLLIY